MVMNAFVAMATLIAAYVGWGAISSGHHLFLIHSAVLFVACAGLLARKGWSAYLWHAIAALVSIEWTYTIAVTVMNGWPYEDAATTMISLIPGIFMVAVFLGGSAAIHKQRARASVNRKN